MHAIRTLAAFGMLLLTQSNAGVHAEAPILFPADQFGKRDLVPKQSNTSAGRLLESLGGKEDRFEPVSRFRVDDPMRIAGRSVGSLRMLVQSGSGSEGVAVCTATLIGPDRLLTNAHCIPGDEGKVVKAEIWFGYLRLGDEGGHAYPVDIAPVEYDRKLDFALLRVHGEPAKRFPPARLSPRAVLENESLFLIHHPGGQPQKLTRAFCRSLPEKPIDGTIVRHQCDTLGGSSGTLIFAQSDGAIVGLHHSGGLTHNDPTSFNQGTDAVALKTRIASVTVMSSVVEAVAGAGPALKGLVGLGGQPAAVPTSRPPLNVAVAPPGTSPPAALTDPKVLFGDKGNRIGTANAAAPPAPPLGPSAQKAAPPLTAAQQAELSRLYDAAIAHLRYHTMMGIASRNIKGDVANRYLTAGEFKFPVGVFKSTLQAAERVSVQHHYITAMSKILSAYDTSAAAMAAFAEEKERLR